MNRARRRVYTTSALLAAAGAAVVAAAFLTRGSGQAEIAEPPEPPEFAEPIPEFAEPIPEIAEPFSEDRPRIDVVFALDTTGSMGGMIEGAKQKIWSLANEIASGKPQPIVRFGLVAYRDKGDEYVTRTTPLTDDMDLIYENLMGLRAAGGGDRPEHVNRALLDALEMDWSQGDNVLKLVFLVGDAPPHEHYTDTPTSAELARRARAGGIAINTIRCGQADDTKQSWIRIAQLSGGEFATIAQSGGVVAVATPFDAELERLNRELAGTGIGWGSDADRELVERRTATRKAMRSEVAAAAASYSARSGGGFVGKGDLVADVERGRVAVEGVAAEELPEEMRSMTGAERGAYVAAKQAERAEIQKRIQAAAREREAWLKENRPRDRDRDALDDKIMGAVELKAADIGVSW